MLLLDRRTFDPSRRLHGHGRAVSLATSFDEHYPMLCDMASEQMNVWCSTPRTATVSSGTTFVRINSAPQAVQRITRTGTHTHRAPTRYWYCRHWPRDAVVTRYGCG